MKKTEVLKMRNLGTFHFFQNLEIFEIFETKKYREKYRDKVKI